MGTPLELFLRSLDEATHQDETYDLNLFGSLDSYERPLAVAELVRRVDEQADRLALLTLSRGGAPEALPLARVLGRRSGPTGFWARLALVELGHGDEARAGLMTDLEQSWPLIRFGAIAALQRLGDPAATAALLQALDDPTDTVRLRALDGLIAQYGLEQHRWLPGTKRKNLLSPLAVEELLLGSDARVLAEQARTQLRRWFAALQSGCSAEELSLTWTAPDGESFRDLVGGALRMTSATLPLDVIAAAHPQHRRWAEALFVYNIANFPGDARLPAALARLGATWTLPLLESLADSLSPDVVVALDLRTALDTLRARPELPAPGHT